MTLLGRIVPSALALFLAPVLLLQGYSNAKSQPGLISWNGFWQADLTSEFIQIGEADGALDLRVTSQGVDLAQQAYSQEPLASDALFALALDRRGQGDFEGMSAILAATERLDRRNQSLGALQLERAAAEGDFPLAFQVLGRLSAVHPEMTRQFVAPLVSAITEDGVLPVLYDALQDEPNWARAFWGYAPSDEAGLQRMLELRQMTSKGATAETDAVMLRRLVTGAYYADAFAFWREIDAEDAGEFAFVNGTRFAPIGWDLASSGDHALYERSGGAFDVFVQGQSSGELARQLVQLEPGTYEFSARVNPSDRAGDIAAQLQCVTGEQDEGIPMPLDEVARWNVSGSCDAYWLILTGSAWDSRTSLRAQLSDLRFAAGS